MADIYVATTGNDTTGDGSVGNPYASPGKAAGVKSSGDRVFVKAGTYSITTASTNVAGGCVNDTHSISLWYGYDTSATVTNTDAARPLLQASGISTATLFKQTGTGGADRHLVRNIRADGAGLTSIRGFDLSGSFGGVYCERCEAMNCTNSGFLVGVDGAEVVGCHATGCSSAGAGFLTSTGAKYYGCEASANSVPGFSHTGSANGSTYVRCVARGQTGSAAGFVVTNASGHLHDCVARGNAGSGFDLSNPNVRVVTCVNCLAYGNAAYGFNGHATLNRILVNCGYGSNTSGNTNNISHDIGGITLSADPHTSSTDLSLNAAAGGGALLRGAGWPGVFPGGTTTGYPDVGGVQHQDAGGAGGSVFPVIGGGGLVF